MTTSMFFLFALISVSVWSSLADSSEDSLTFLLLGDWGKGGTTGTFGQRRYLKGPESEVTHGNEKEILKEKKVLRQMQVATAMGQYSAEADPKPSFVIALGDNFYDNGVYSSTDSLWDYLWKDVYLGFEGLNIPWYPVFGNHDYGYGATGVKAQIQRTYEHTDDDIWMMESTNYTKRFTIPGAGGGTVCILFIDTTTLAPSVNRCCNQNGGVSEQTQKERITDQLAHITRALEETVTDPPTWLLVAGHYPVFSASTNGDASELSQYLLPLLQQYKVHAYLCGHDHIAEHLQHANYFSEFFVVGAGTMTDTIDTSKTKASLVWGGPSYSSFAAMTATTKDLTIDFRDTNNTVRYSYTLTNPNKVAVELPGPPGDGDEDSGGGNGGSGGNGDDGGNNDAGGNTGRGGHSFFSWEYWAEASQNPAKAKVAVASGGMVVMGLMVLLCYGVYRARRSGETKLAKDKFLEKARSTQLVHSPHARGVSKQGAFYSRKRYIELMELGEAEANALEFDSDEEGGGTPRKAPGRYALIQESTAPTEEPDTVDNDDFAIGAAMMAGTASTDGSQERSRSRSSTLKDNTTHSRESTISSGRASTGTAADSHVTAHSRESSGARAGTVVDSTGSAHSRDSSGGAGAFSPSTHQNMYSAALTPEQANIATLWLASHPTRSSTPMPSPPPPSPRTRANSVLSQNPTTPCTSNPLVCAATAPLGIAETQEVSSAAGQGSSPAGYTPVSPRDGALPPKQPAHRRTTTSPM